MKIVWTRQASKGWQEVASYIRREFGTQGLIQFQTQTKECEDSILQMPNAGSIEWDDSDETTIYRYRVINRRSKLLYFVEGDVIYIADFWDVRSSHK